MQTLTISVPRINVVAVGSVDANAVFQQAQGAGNCRVRPNHAWQRQANRLDTAEIVARVVEVEDLFGQTDEAPAGFSESHQRQGVELQKRDVFGQLELAAVLLQVCRLQAAQVVLELFTR